MRLRLLAGLVCLAAGLLHFGLAAPTRTRAAAAQEEFGRLRVERQRLRARLAQLERRRAAVERAALVLDAEGPKGDAVNALRLFVVDALRRRAVSDGRLSVGVGRPPVAATVRLSVAGSFGELVRLCDDLARPGSGLVLERVRLSGGGSAVELDLEGLRLGVRP